MTRSPLVRWELLLLFALDRLVKNWVFKWHCSAKDHLFPKFEFGLFGQKVLASIVYVTNTGAAWGLFAARPLLLNCLRSGFILAIAIYLWRTPQMPRGNRLCWSIIAVAALSNLADVRIYGHIVDMFSVRFGRWEFAVFNLADASITLCWMWLLLGQLSFRSQKRRSLPLRIE